MQLFHPECLAFSKEETASDWYRREMCELTATEFGTQMKRAMQLLWNSNYNLIHLAIPSVRYWSLTLREVHAILSDHYWTVGRPGKKAAILACINYSLIIIKVKHWPQYLLKRAFIRALILIQRHTKWQQIDHTTAMIMNKIKQSFSKNTSQNIS